MSGCFLFVNVCMMGARRPRSGAERAKDFLTQRAVQQTMFCAKVLRDETTVNWLSEFQGHEGLFDLHCCDALKLQSEEYLKSLFNEKTVKWLVKKPIPGRTGSTNPYLKRRYFEYEVDIVPSRLGRRIVVS